MWFEKLASWIEKRGGMRELYRKVAAPYEDEKIDENGDVFDVIKVA